MNHYFHFKDESSNVRNTMCHAQAYVDREWDRQEPEPKLSDSKILFVALGHTHSPKGK